MPSFQCHSSSAVPMRRGCRSSESPCSPNLLGLPFQPCLVQGPGRSAPTRSSLVPLLLQCLKCCTPPSALLHSQKLQELLQILPKIVRLILFSWRAKVEAWDLCGQSQPSSSSLMLSVSCHGLAVLSSLDTFILLLCCSVLSSIYLCPVASL